MVKDKLSGVNPIRVLAQEIKDSKHYKKPYYKALLFAIQGPEGSLRETLLKDGKKYLEVEEQVECLIEQARDPDILGRVWIGWGPYI